jgi:hypothetical protein
LRTERRSALNARLRTSITTGDAGDVALGAGSEVDHRGDQLGRQVVDDEPAQVLEHLRRSAPAGPGQSADQRHLDAVRMLRRCRRMLGHAFSSVPEVSGAGSPADPCSAVRTATAVRRPNPGTAAISSTPAARSLRTDPKCLSSAVRRDGPSPGDAVERGGRHALGTTLAVVGDGEPVRLVPDPLQQVQPLAGAREDDRVRIGRQPDLLQALGQPADRDVGDPELGSTSAAASTCGAPPSTTYRFGG